MAPDDRDPTGSAQTDGIAGNGGSDGIGGDGLGLEARTVVGLHTEGRMQQLDRERPGQDGVRRAPHLAVTAAAHLLGEFVAAAEDRSSQGHQRGLPSSAVVR